MKGINFGGENDFVIKYLFDLKKNLIAFEKNQNIYKINNNRIGWLESCADKQSSNKDKSNTKYDSFDILKDYSWNMPSALLMEGD
ncbi:MAG: hypothetical protein PHY26_04620, partial [Bacilli bacterium]|nr:hypothetical protein [Bacilli bacterium]